MAGFWSPWHSKAWPAEYQLMPCLIFPQRSGKKSCLKKVGGANLCRLPLGIRQRELWSSLTSQVDHRRCAWIRQAQGTTKGSFGTSPDMLIDKTLEKVRPMPTSNRKPFALKHLASEDLLLIAYHNVTASEFSAWLRCKCSLKWPRWHTNKL